MLVSLFLFFFIFRMDRNRSTRFVPTNQADIAAAVKEAKNKSTTKSTKTHLALFKDFLSQDNFYHFVILRDIK